MRRSLTFPSVGSIGYVLGWGRNNANINITTYNRYLQKLELTIFDMNTSACNNTYTLDQKNAAYGVINFLT